MLWHQAYSCALAALRLPDCMSEWLATGCEQPQTMPQTVPKSRRRKSEVHYQLFAASCVFREFRNPNLWWQGTSRRRAARRWAIGVETVMDTEFFREIPNMGVIHVVAEAAKLGFSNGHPDWCNLGQGQPEVGELEDAPPRIDSWDFVRPQDHAYGPVNGITELREAVAEHYNRLYRRDKSTQYCADNVAIAAGGRLALSRIFAAIGRVNLGYQTPDYTAYEDMIGYHQHRFSPVLLATTEAEHFRLSPERFDREVEVHGLSAFVASNPCNPTGEVLYPRELTDYLSTARRRRCLLIMDEFYSHYLYNSDGSPAGCPVSMAAAVEDVEEDPVLIVDGLTKNFRYPGWRIGWVVGPKLLIDAIGRAASAIDGGPPQPMQRAAVRVLEPGRADREVLAVRRAFAQKRGLMREALEALGVRFPGRCDGTFYLWGSIAGLPAPFDDAEHLFRAALAEKVMLVPGRCFDVNPGRLRRHPSRLSQWMRFSFGPQEANVVLGVSRLTSLVRGSCQHSSSGTDRAVGRA
jgi:aspartate/methionine/tyrosine aminotransferase